MLSSPLAYFATITSTVALNSIAVGLGESLISKNALAAINAQPKAKTEINKASILGLALTETSAIIGLVISIVLLSGAGDAQYSWLGLIGIAFAICVSGFAVGIASAMPVREACTAIARQPFFSNKIINTMLITTSFIQTPIIFGFIISLFIYYQLAGCTNITEGIRLLASGLSIGFGSIGSITGLGIFATEACKGIGYNRNAYNRIITFTFISQALIETPVIFALVISLILINSNVPIDSISASVAMLSAAICTSISNVAPGISSGKTAAAACRQITINPDLHSSISRVSMIAQGMLDSFAIYGWAISMFIIIKGLN